MSATIDLGKIRFRHAGAWRFDRSYEKNDVVTYLGSSYACLVDHESDRDNEFAQTYINHPVLGSSKGTYWGVVAKGADAVQTITGNGGLITRYGTTPAAGEVTQLSASLANVNDSLHIVDENKNIGWVPNTVLQMSMIVDTQARGRISTSVPYYFGADESEAMTIVPKSADSYLIVDYQLFGEVTNHNAVGKLQYSRNGGGWADLQISSATGTQGHIMLNPYETQYANTPHQAGTSVFYDVGEIANTTEVRFRFIMVTHSMDINEAVTAGAEAGISFIKVTEVNNNAVNMVVR
jgi:hypothetical protein